MRYDAVVRWRLALVLIVAALGLAASVRAEIYRYSDEAGHTHFVDGLDNVPLPHRAGAVPVGLRNRPAASTPGAGEAEPARSSGRTVLRYTPGQRIFVDVTINASVTAKLLLDTGADRTMISPRTLQAAGASLARPVGAGQVTGVTGTDRILYVVVDSLQVGEARVGRMPVAAYQLPDSSTGDGLLGRDFLDRFRMTIDATRGEVTLTPK